MAESRNKYVIIKLVQEIAGKGEEVPEKYIIKNNDVISLAIDAPSNLWDETLLIDFSLLSANSSSAHQNELANRSQKLGFFPDYKPYNGMTSLFLDELLEVSRQFFSLPSEEKLKYSALEEDFFNGYGNVTVIAGDKPISWTDRLFLTICPEDQRKLQFWPQKPRKFSEILHEYSLSLRVIIEVILKAMARSLELREDSFFKEHGERVFIETRFGIYPRCSLPDKVYGVRPHSDRSSITVLLPDKNVPESLHILKDDQWLKVPVIPGALVVNVGDFGELNDSLIHYDIYEIFDFPHHPKFFLYTWGCKVMSNGIFKSVVHRVVTNSERERFPVTSFCTPKTGNEVGPINELISANQPALYKKVSMKIYKQLFVETTSTQDKKRVLDALKI